MSRRTSSLLLTVLILSIAIPVSSPTEARAAEAVSPIRFVPENDASHIRLDARFSPKPELCDARQPRNLHSAYPGVIEIGRRNDGRLYLVTELTFPKYLEGIAEVPRDWPLEALKAQVIAARTYAVAHMNPSNEQARELRYNLCATDSCQVYRGLNVAGGAWGEFWVQAVRETGGEILEHNGSPANTFYYSTSNGRTYSNADAFGGSPLPYLKPVDETDDGGSPVRKWKVKMSLQDLTETLRLAKAWEAGTIDRVEQSGETVTLSGSGSEASMSLTQLRNRLNAQAVCLTPKRYPTAQPNGKPLPQVVPSKWFTLRQEGGDLVLEGEGWGHGVGMVQWGLKGKAERGMNYQDMLAFYYAGLRPVKRQDPSSIRVGLAVDMETISLERVGKVRVEGIQVPDGPLQITGGPTVKVESGPSIPALLKVENLGFQPQAAPSQPLSLTFELSAPAKVKLNYKGPTSGETPAEPRDRGDQQLVWNPSGLPNGLYEVNVAAFDGVDSVTSAALEIPVTSTPTGESPSLSPKALPPAANDSDNSSWAFVGVVAALFVGIGTVVFIRGRRTRSSIQR